MDIITNYLVSTQLRKKKKVLSTLGASRDRAKRSIKSNKIKKARDPSSLSATEMVHVPVFILPKVVFTREKFKVTAKVGQRNHPMVDKHYIHWLELYQDGVLLKKTEFKPGQEPKITALVQIGNVTELKAVTRCTMHGLWQAEKQIHAR
jgi:superoxide reductase